MITPFIGIFSLRQQSRRKLVLSMLTFYESLLSFFSSCLNALLKSPEVLAKCNLSSVNNLAKGKFKKLVYLAFSLVLNQTSKGFKVADVSVVLCAFLWCTMLPLVP